MSDIIKYAEIQGIISKYYPLGIDRSDPKYEEYKGTSDLKTLVAEHLHNSQKRSQWDTLINTIKAVFPELIEVREIRQPFDTCYSLEIPINRREIDNFVYEQRLYCHLSFLGKYFCLYGLDYIQVHNNENRIQFQPVLTISPCNNYQEYLKKIRILTEEGFPTYRFLSFLYLRIQVDGLRIFSNLLKGNQFSNVFQALFIPKNITDYVRYGDMHYK